MACERPKPFHVHETHSHFGNPFLQKSFRLLGKRLWHVICAHNRYGEWMIGEASGIVGRFESRLRQQRNHTIVPAVGSPLDFHYQLLAGARSNQIGGRSALARLLDREKSVPYLWHVWENRCMKEQAIRTTVDIPASLYRKLKEQAAAQGRSIRELILLGVRVTLIEGKRPRSKRVKFPLIASDGPKVDLTNEQIYEHLEFP